MILRTRPLPPRPCKACDESIEKPQPGQKVHARLACQRKWIKMRSETKKGKAIAAFKKVRAKIGAIKGTKPVRDRAYLAWIRTLACLLCGTHTGIQAAHSGPHGISQKAPDTSALPLCQRCHISGPGSYHALGRRFFETHRLKPREELVAAYNLAYRESREVAA